MLENIQELISFLKENISEEICTYSPSAQKGARTHHMVFSTYLHLMVCVKFSQPFAHPFSYHGWNVTSSPLHCNFTSHRNYSREYGQNLLTALDMSAACFAVIVPLLQQVPRAMQSFPEPCSQQSVRMHTSSILCFGTIERKSPPTTVLPVPRTKRARRASAALPGAVGRRGKQERSEGGENSV